jgi:hypothetical protein
LFILVKSEICESKKVAQAPFPTRGVPNVTPRTVVPTGRLSFMNNVSSSASAPPREWPIYIMIEIGAKFRSVAAMTYKDDMGWRVLGHQPFDFGKDFWRSLLVLICKTGVK